MCVTTLLCHSKDLPNVSSWHNLNIKTRDDEKGKYLFKTFKFETSPNLIKLTHSLQPRHPGPRTYFFRPSFLAPTCDSYNLVVFKTIFLVSLVLVFFVQRVPINPYRRRRCPPGLFVIIVNFLCVLVVIRSASSAEMWLYLLLIVGLLLYYGWRKRMEKFQKWSHLPQPEKPHWYWGNKPLFSKGPSDTMLDFYNALKGHR